MCKFVEQAVKNNEDKTTKQVAEEVMPILKANLEAMASAQRGVRIKAESTFKTRESEVNSAIGYITEDAELYANNIIRAETRRDEAAEDLLEAQALEDKLNEMVKVNFS